MIVGELTLDGIPLYKNGVFRYRSSKKKLLKKCDICGFESWVRIDKLLRCRQRGNGLDYCYNCRGLKISISFHMKSDEEKREIVRKRKQTNLEVFGVPCSFQNSKVRERFRENSLKNYGFEHPNQRFEFRKYMSEIRVGENNPAWNPNRENWEEKTSFMYETRRLSEIEYVKFGDIINPNELDRGNGKYHLDHKFSIIESFNVGVRDPYIPSRCGNLQILPSIENGTKHSKCSIPLSQLLSFSNIPCNSSLSSDPNAYRIFTSNKLESEYK